MTSISMCHNINVTKTWPKTECLPHCWTIIACLALTTIRIPIFSIINLVKSMTINIPQTTHKRLAVDLSCSPKSSTKRLGSDPTHRRKTPLFAPKSSTKTNQMLTRNSFLKRNYQCHRARTKMLANSSTLAHSRTLEATSLLTMVLAVITAHFSCLATLSKFEKVRCNLTRSSPFVKSLKRKQAFLWVASIKIKFGTLECPRLLSLVESPTKAKTVKKAVRRARCWSTLHWESKLQG